MYDHQWQVMGDVDEKALSWETVKINTEGPLEEIRETSESHEICYRKLEWEL